MHAADDALRCRWLAVMAWIGALVWFAFATIAGLGYAPGGLFWWSFAAFPLAKTTLGWLARRGRPVADSLLKHGAWIWIALVGLQLGLAVFGVLAGDGALSEHTFAALFWPMQITYIGFVITVTAGAIWLSLRPSPSGK